VSIRAAAPPLCRGQSWCGSPASVAHAWTPAAAPDEIPRHRMRGDRESIATRA